MPLEFRFPAHYDLDQNLKSLTIRVLRGVLLVFQIFQSNTSGNIKFFFLQFKTIQVVRSNYNKKKVKHILHSFIF